MHEKLPQEGITHREALATSLLLFTLLLFLVNCSNQAAVPSLISPTPTLGYNVDLCKPTEPFNLLPGQVSHTNPILKSTLPTWDNVAASGHGFILENNSHFEIAIIQHVAIYSYKLCSFALLPNGDNINLNPPAEIRNEELFNAPSKTGDPIIRFPLSSLDETRVTNLAEEGVLKPLVRTDDVKPGDQIAIPHYGEVEPQIFIVDRLDSENNRFILTGINQENQLCHGDSGSPALKVIAGEITNLVVGSASSIQEEPFGPPSVCGSLIAVTRF